MKENAKKVPVKFEPSADEPEVQAAPPEESRAAEGAATEESAAEAALREQLSRLQAERDELQRTLVRRQADFENYRKRIERERREDAERTSARLVESLLPVLDAFERALAAAGDAGGAAEEYRRGFELIYRQLNEALARLKLERIAALGRPFNPHEHHAVERVETAEHPEGTVVEVLQPGYRIGQRVLRPSMVRVAARPADDKPQAGEASPDAPVN